MSTTAAAAAAASNLRERKGSPRFDEIQFCIDDMTISFLLSKLEQATCVLKVYSSSCMVLFSSVLNIDHERRSLSWSVRQRRADPSHIVGPMKAVRALRSKLGMDGK